MHFDWDEKKNQLNFRNHKIWFEEAQTVWADSGAQEFFDSDHSDDEDRYIRVGYSTHSRLLLVFFANETRGIPPELLVLEKLLLRSEKIMKKEYDLKSLKKRPGAVKVDPSAAKVATSIRLDGSVFACLENRSGAIRDSLSNTH